jgi:hypothetical protein
MKPLARILMTVVALAMGPTASANQNNDTNRHFLPRKVLDKIEKPPGPENQSEQVTDGLRSARHGK